MKALQILILATAMTLILMPFQAIAEDETSKTASSSGVLHVYDPISGDDLIAAGAGVCQQYTTLLPHHCSSSGSGAVMFDISHLNVNKVAHVITGLVTVETMNCNPCGSMTVTVCNDRDDDNHCTRLDLIDDDGPSKAGNHGTNESHDDQLVHKDCGKTSPFSRCEVRFCFADDAVTHDWDTIAVFIETEIGRPSSGIANVTLKDVWHVGDNLQDCPGPWWDPDGTPGHRVSCT